MPSAKFGRPCTGLQRSLLSKRIRLDYGAQVLSDFDAETVHRVSLRKGNLALVKFYVTNMHSMSFEDRKSWEVPNCEVLGLLDADNDSFVFVRVKQSVKLSDEDFGFIKTKLKDAGGTFWFGARLWIVERSQAEGALNEIAAYFDR